MAIIRQKRKAKFSVVDNKMIEDVRLSFKARGLLIYMLSKPDDWKFYTEELVKHSSKDGLSAIKSALREIEQAGYLTRKRERSKNGRFLSQDWVLNDTPAFSPQVDFPPVEKPQVDKPAVENQPLLNTDIPNTNILNTEKQLADGTSISREKVFNLWQDNWGFPNGIAQQDLNEWINEFGTELVHHAIVYALQFNVSSRGADRYLARKFDGYRKSKISTVDQAKANEEKHRQQMNREFQAKRGFSKKSVSSSNQNNRDTEFFRNDGPSLDEQLAALGENGDV